jgi:A/G-specific adenine glycosylase
VKKNDRQYSHEGLTPATIVFFRKLVYRYYRLHGRSFPWRDTTNPYHILVSEIMLQQTPTTRVEKKYGEFIAEFPDFTSLARAPLADVIRMWKGLGYNRRALALQNTAQTIVTRYNNVLPDCPEELITLPGIGRYTAAAVVTFAYNRPTVFMDTNIRDVFIHLFFDHRENIFDREILPFVELTLDRNDPRQWYYALFDYGAMLKMKINENTRSVHYRKQKPFKGSNREVRGNIIGLLLENTTLSYSEIVQHLNLRSVVVMENVTQLKKEGFITVVKDAVRLNDGSGHVV